MADDASTLYNTLSSGRKAALHAAFRNYAPNKQKNAYLLDPAMFQEFLKTPQALQTLIGTGYQPGVTPAQSVMTRTPEEVAAQNAQGRANASAYEQQVGNRFTTQINPLLTLAQAMARVQPGRVTTPQFNLQAGTNDFAQFAQANQASNPIPTAPGIASIPGFAASAAPRPVDKSPGPSQQEFVSTIQNGLRLGKGRTSGRF